MSDPISTDSISPSTTLPSATSSPTVAAPPTTTTAATDPAAVSVQATEVLSPPKGGADSTPAAPPSFVTTDVMESRLNAVGEAVAQLATDLNEKLGGNTQAMVDTLNQQSRVIADLRNQVDALTKQLDEVTAEPDLPKVGDTVGFIEDNTSLNNAGTVIPAIITSVLSKQYVNLRLIQDNDPQHDRHVTSVLRFNGVGTPPRRSWSYTK